MAPNFVDQLLNFYMPRIFWHDRKGILSIDVLQQRQTEPKNMSLKNESDHQPQLSKYKIVTASMQKEIRVWNFGFAHVASSTKEPMTSVTEPKIMPVVAIADKPNSPLLPIEPPNQLMEDQDSVMLLDDPEKENNVQEAEAQVKEETERATKQWGGDGVKRTIVPSNELFVEFLANIEGHRGTTNVVRFSPNGHYIASGDADGFLCVWKLENHTAMECEGEAKMVMDVSATVRKRDADPEMDIPPNKEDWVRAFRSPIRHDGDVTGICWSPDSQMLASVSMDDSVAVHRADNGKRVWAIRNYRHFANGIAWDPRGRYLITLSTDRRMDILDALKGTRLRCCHQIEFPLTPLLRPDGSEMRQKFYKVFHDDQLFAFQRGVEFSPCGGVVFAPAVHLEVAALNVYGVFAFLRSNFDVCRPTALYQSVKPAIQAKCSPILYQLAEGPNFLGLSYRLIFAVLCRDSVLLYSSQNEFPLAYIENLQYDKLTSMDWTPDGRVLVVSSMEGFNSFITVDSTILGIPNEQQNLSILFGDEMPITPSRTKKNISIRKRCTEKKSS